ncbi:MAG: hypothetical protein WCD79_15065 [Chthoniobacteraceae bacterium]
MSTLLGTCICIALVAFVIWGLIPSKSSGDKTAPSSPNDQIIDPTDSYQIGLIIGAAGGSIADAATARYALQRFEEIHGRKPTVRDLGTVAGLTMPPTQ